MTPHGPGPVALAVVSAAERALSALSWREAAPIPVRQIAAAEASPGPGLCALWGRIPPLISACALLCISESDITMISSLSSMKLSAALIAGLVVVARGLNSEYGGFVHIANWGGAILDPPHDSKGWVLPGGGGPPADLAQAVCSFDNNCTNFGFEYAGSAIFRRSKYDDAFDLYLATYTDTSIVPSAMCNIIGGGSYHPNGKMAALRQRPVGYNCHQHICTSP